jgi:hypothetical protein
MIFEVRRVRNANGNAKDRHRTGCRVDQIAVALEARRRRQLQLDADPARLQHTRSTDCALGLNTNVEREVGACSTADFASDVPLAKMSAASRGESSRYGCFPKKKRALVAVRSQIWTRC